MAEDPWTCNGITQGCRGEQQKGKLIPAVLIKVDQSFYSLGGDIGELYLQDVKGALHGALLIQLITGDNLFML